MIDSAFHLLHTSYYCILRCEMQKLRVGAVLEVVASGEYCPLASLATTPSRSCSQCERTHATPCDMIHARHRRTPQNLPFRANRSIGDFSLMWSPVGGVTQEESSPPQNAAARRIGAISE